MTWIRSALRGRFFVKNSSLLELTLPIHNEALSGDELTTIQLNHEWRRIVTSALFYYFKHGTTELALDNEDLLDDVLEDLYNAETFMNRKFRAVNLSFGVNRTTTSLSAVVIIGSTFNHTFTYKNAKITLLNLALSNSGSGNITRAKINVSSESPEEEGFASTEGTNQRTMQAESVYSDLVTGVSRTIGAHFWVSGGTGTAVANSELIFMIEEWD